MQENLHCEKEEKPKIRDENQKQRPSTKSKNRKNKAAVDTTRKINDYFPQVPKSNKESKEDKGVGGKDETRVTDYTTPDKASKENGKSHTQDPNPSKLSISN